MGTSGSRKCVLIVEDDISLAQAWKARLEEIGYDILICAQVENGLDICAKRWPDVIVLDGFFLDEKGIPRGEGAVLFCTTIASYAESHGKALPPIIGVTGVRPLEDIPGDVFTPIPLEVMPTRMRKPFAPDALAYEVERAFA